MHFVKFHPEVASCLLSRGKRKYAPPGDEANMKVHKKLVSGAKILDLQPEKYGLSFDNKKSTTG